MSLLRKSYEEAGSLQLGTTFDLSTQIGIFTASIDFSQDYYKEKKKKNAKILSSDLIGENLCNQLNTFELFGFHIPNRQRNGEFKSKEGN